MKSDNSKTLCRRFFYAGWIAALAACLHMTGCGGSNEPTWYEQSLEGKQSREEFIRNQVESGLDPREARDLYDRKLFEMNTINMAREGEAAE